MYPRTGFAHAKQLTKLCCYFLEGGEDILTVMVLKLLDLLSFVEVSDNSSGDGSFYNKHLLYKSLYPLTLSLSETVETVISFIFGISLILSAVALSMKTARFAFSLTLPSGYNILIS